MEMIEEKRSELEERKAKENACENPPYPTSTIFILVGYLLERFVYYGLFGGVVLYMQRVLNFSSSTSSTLKAFSEGLIYLSPIIGAVIADSYLGKIRTVLILYCVYVCGTIIFSLSAVPPLVSNLLLKQILGICGMLVFGLAAGLMKATYTSLGPDQFEVPQQRRSQQRFFQAFYWMINAGAFFGQVLTAQLRSSTQCFGGDCYILPFGILCFLILLSMVVFLCGKEKYKEVPPDETLINSIKCIFYACRKYWIIPKKSVSHWIERSADKYDNDLINDIRKILRVLLLFITFPLFWALFYQTSTGMIFQAKRLNDRIGTYRIPPEITSSINPLLILVLIPLFEFIIYPFLERRGHLKNTKTKMSIGMILVCVSFLFYGVVNISVEQNILGANQAELNFYNADNCTLTIFSKWFPDAVVIKPKHQYKISPITLDKDKSYMRYNFTCGEIFKENEAFLMEHHESSIFISEEKVINLKPSKDYLKDKDGEAKVRISLISEEFLNVEGSHITLKYGELIDAFNIEIGVSVVSKIRPNPYIIMIDGERVGEIDIKQDGIYDILLAKNESYVFNLIYPSKTHILWLLPQYLLITTGEVLFSISAMDFAYAEVPKSMKSVMQAANLFTITVGLWIFALVTKINELTGLFEHRASNEAFSYAFLMAIDTLILILLSRYYDKEKLTKVNK